MADDRALTGSTIDWFVSLPAPTKPESLCRQFPRVANMIAMMWPQRELTVVMVERLLTDDRSGTRAGFPADVTEDLKLLLQLRRGADNP